MEIFLLVLVLVFLFVIKTSFDDKIDAVEQRLKKITNALELLKIQGIAQPIATNVVTPKTEASVVTPVTPPLIIVTVPQTISTPPPLAPPVVTPPVTTATEPQKTMAYFTDKDTAVNPTLAPKPSIVKPPAPPQQSWWENFKEKNPDLEKFIGEDLIAKIGILILVLGISYFVKFAIDKNWINEPARVGIGVLCGALVMGIAHKLRMQYAAFSSVFVAGAIAIFYFTIGIAFHDYHLFNQTVTFVIMVIITAFSSLISLSYNRKELAVLSLIGGFAVPFMVSTGAGNYIALFSYIIILNVGILALAYYRKWTIINLLTYLFTVVLYGAWLAKTFSYGAITPPYLGALVFGFVFYLLFILTNIINNIRTKGQFSTTEISVLASSTFLFYGAGMFILTNYHPELKGAFTTLLGLLNLLYAWILYKKFQVNKSAIYLLIGLTLTFVTLAIPIQFNGNYITLFWAAEAVLLMWLAQKSNSIAYKFGSVVVHGLMLISLFLDWDNIYNYDFDMMLFVNKGFITGVFAVLSFVSIYFIQKNEVDEFKKFGLTFKSVAYTNLVKIVAIVLAYFVGMLEVYNQAYLYFDTATAVAFPTMYHLLFSAVVIYYLCKTNNLLNQQLAAIIGVVNVVVYTFIFSRGAINEYRDYVLTGVSHHLAFYLHYISLVAIVYISYQLYQLSQSSNGIKELRNPLVTWFATACVVITTSQELITHWIVFKTPPEVNSDASYDFVSVTINQIVKTGFPILWGVLAFVFLIIGIKQQYKTLRVIALSLLGLTIVKLFVYDIKNVSETGKIVAFILLGVLILIISFVYQKIKVLVIDDAPAVPPTNTTPPTNEIS